MGGNKGRVLLKKVGFCKTHFNGNFMSKGFKWPLLGYTILVLIPSIVPLCINRVYTHLPSGWRHEASSEG